MAAPLAGAARRQEVEGREPLDLRRKLEGAEAVKGAEGEVSLARRLGPGLRQAHPLEILVPRRGLGGWVSTPRRWLS